MVVYPEKTVIFLSIREFPILLDALSAKREYYFLKAKSLVFTLLSQMIFLFFFLTVHPESKLILCHLSLVMLPYQNLYSVEMLLFRHLIPIRYNIFIKGHCIHVSSNKFIQSIFIKNITRNINIFCNSILMIILKIML